MTHLGLVQGNTKQQNTLETFLHQRFKESVELVDAPALLTRQRFNLDLGVGFVHQEDGIHQHVSRRIAVQLVGISIAGRLVKLLGELPLRLQSARQWMLISALQNARNAFMHIQFSV